MQPTNRLYYDHAYLTAFDARVVAVRSDGWTALDCSAFYPTSGGQPYDTGTLQWGDVTAHVTDVEVQDGTVWHKLDALPPQPLVFTKTTGRLDVWRYGSREHAKIVTVF